MKPTGVPSQRSTAHPRGFRVSGVGIHGSAFRQHDQQTSNTAYPGFSAGLFEWELFLRWAVDCGDLDPARYAAAVPALHAQYRQHVAQFPELAALLELGGRPGADRHLSDEFRELASLAYLTIELRKLARAGHGLDA